MKLSQPRVCVALAWLFAGLLFADVTIADEGFFSRVNPWRKSAASTAPAPASAPATPMVEPSSFGSGFSLPKFGQLFSGSAAPSTSTSEPAPPAYNAEAIEARMAQMTVAGAQKLDQRLPAVERMKTQMQAQGYDTEAIETSVAQMTAAGAQNVQQRLPSVDEVRAKMQAQGYDTAAIEARIAQLTAAGQIGMQAYQAYGSQLPSLDQVRAQMQSQGYDRAAIEAKVSQLASAGTQQLVQHLPSAADVRAQMTAKGYDTAAIETRVAQLAAAGQLATQTYQSFGQAVVDDPAGSQAELPASTPSQTTPPANAKSPMGQMLNWWNKK